MKFYFENLFFEILFVIVIITLEEYDLYKNTFLIYILFLFRFLIKFLISLKEI